MWEIRSTRCIIEREDIAEKTAYDAARKASRPVSKVLHLLPSGINCPELRLVHPIIQYWNSLEYGSIPAFCIDSDIITSDCSCNIGIINSIEDKDMLKTRPEPPDLSSTANIHRDHRIIICSVRRWDCRSSIRPPSCWLREINSDSNRRPSLLCLRSSSSHCGVDIITSRPLNCRGRIHNR